VIALDTVNRAQHRWREILPRLGVETRFLTNRHGPCPICGGRDRFRFDDRDGTGSYYCNQCGPGPGLLLLRKPHNWDFKTACDEVDKIIGTNPPRVVHPAPSRDNPSAKHAALHRTLGEADAPDIVGHYLVDRGLSVSSAVLLGHPALPYYRDGAKGAERYPAVLAPVVGVSGDLRSVHRIYVADVEPRKKLMPPAGTVIGAAVQLHRPTDGELGVAEGIETALAAKELFGVPTWAAISTTGIVGFEPPPGIRKLTVFADNDANAAGPLAAYTLAKRLHPAGIEVRVKILPEVDTDWLDVLNARKTACRQRGCNTKES
jgi:putative DNA primase/helicase